ncbi:MAG: DUF262 domain-containing protein [Lachnospiraceae bacterium]|nr:DUF262 domain-containing protein [Lachnospiraceae bacterium]
MKQKINCQYISKNFCTLSSCEYYNQYCVGENCPYFIKTQNKTIVIKQNSYNSRNKEYLGENKESVSKTVTISSNKNSLDSEHKNFNDFLDNDEEDSDFRLFEISTLPLTPNIKSLCIDWEDKTLQIPKYQRRFVWTLKQSSLFIESLMLDLPIPTLMFFVDENENNIIIDGQQRMKSLLYFLGTISKEEAPVKEQKFINFRLQGLPENSPWFNKKFSEFSEKDQKKLRNKKLDVTLIRLKNPKDLTSIFYIFERLNKGGTILNAQEIRNCIYSGSFNDFLLELNKYDNWRKIFTSDEDICRQKDVELILRFFALYDNLKNYKKPMKDFLSKYMEEPSIRYMTESELEVKENLFKRTVDAIIMCLGEKPFHIKNGLNSSVCDAVMLAFANKLDKIPENIKDNYKKLKQNKSFYSYVSKSSNDVNSVIQRISIAEAFLFPSLGEIRDIKLYELPVSAGMGNWMDDDNIPFELYQTNNLNADFAVKVSGDSMEPRIHDCDILLVKKQSDILPSDIGIFVYCNRVYCKKFVKAKALYLMSLNQQYKPIKIVNKDEFSVNGKVIDVIHTENNIKVSKKCIQCGEPVWNGSDYCWEHYKYHNAESK